MTNGGAPRSADRLPWLSDEPQRPRRRLRCELVGWAVVATILIATISYRAGLQSRRADESVNRLGDTTIVSLPEVRPLNPSTLNTGAGSRIKPKPVPALPGPRKVRASDQNAEGIVGRLSKRAGHASIGRFSDTKRAQRDELETDQPLLWSAEKVEGASGRLVRVGNFRSAEEAEEGWRATLRKYPGMQRLPSRVVPIQSLRDGRTQYRIQVGTTSQAHSEVLCQRVRAIHHSCTVIGVDEGSETRM